MIETQPLLRVLDPNGHIDELRRRLRREQRGAETLRFVQPSPFQEGLCAAYQVAIDLLEHCHRHQRRWYDQQDLLMVLGGLEDTYRKRLIEEQYTTNPWFLGFSRIWRRVLAILERLPVVEEESSQTEN